MKSIRFKLIFIYFILVFIVMIISGTYIILSIQTQEMKKVEEELKNSARYVKEQVIDSYDNSLEYNNILKSLLIQRVFPLQNAQINILDNSGKTIASTVETGNNKFFEYKNSVIISALAGKENFSKLNKNTNTIDNKTWLGYGYPVLDKNSNLKYVIYIQKDFNTIAHNLRQTTNIIAVSVLIALFFAILLGSLFSTTITAPISLLTKKANLLAKGHLEQHITVKDDDEIGQLTKSFNHMARELRKTVSEMENENNKLEILLHNMTDGVVAFDHIGSLIHANKVFYQLMALRETEEYKITLNFFLNKINSDKKNINMQKKYRNNGKCKPKIY